MEEEMKGVAVGRVEEVMEVVALGRWGGWRRREGGGEGKYSDISKVSLRAGGANDSTQRENFKMRTSVSRWQRVSSLALALSLSTPISLPSPSSSPSPPLSFFLSPSPSLPLSPSQESVDQSHAARERSPNGVT